MPATAITDPGEIPTWTYDNADAIRQRAQQAFQALTATIQPMVASGDVASAQRVLAASPPPNQPPQLPSFAKAVGDSLKVQWGSGLRGATSVDAGTPDGTQAPDFSLPSGNDLTVGTPQQQAAPPEAPAPTNGDLGIMTQGASGGGSFLDAVKNGVASAMGQSAALATPLLMPGGSFRDALQAGVARVMGGNTPPPGNPNSVMDALAQQFPARAAAGYPGGWTPAEQAAHDQLLGQSPDALGVATPGGNPVTDVLNTTNLAKLPGGHLASGIIGGVADAATLGALSGTAGGNTDVSSPGLWADAASAAANAALLHGGAGPLEEGIASRLGGGRVASLAGKFAGGATVGTAFGAAGQVATGKFDPKALAENALLAGTLTAGPAALGEAGRLAMPAARALGGGYRDLLGPEGSLSSAVQKIVPGMGGSVINDSHPQAAPYVEALSRNGIDFHFDDTGNIVVDDPTGAQQIVDRLQTSAIQNIEGTKIPGGSGGTSTPKFGSAEYEDMMNRRRIESENSPTGSLPRPGSKATSLPGGDNSDYQALNDAERISEVLSPDAVPLTSESVRTPPEPGSQLLNHPALPDEQRATLETQAVNRTKGNLNTAKQAATLLGQDDADRFAQGLIDAGLPPRAVSTAISSEISSRGFTVGRTKLSLRETAYRTHLTDIAHELDDTGHAALHNPSRGTETTPASPLPVGRIGDAGASTSAGQVQEAGQIGTGAEANAAGAVSSAPGMGTAAPGDLTVKRPDLFGGVHDTFQTEAELNGFRQTQGGLRLSDAGASSAADVPQPVAPPPAQAPEPLAGVTGAGETPLAAPPVGATLRTHVNRIFGGTLTKPPEPSLMNLPGDELTGFAHPQEGLSVGQRLSNTLRNRLGQPEKFNPVVTPIMEDMRQNAATLKSQAIAMAEEAKQTWGMFKHDPQGRVILADGTKAFLPDLAQQFQQAPDSLVGKLTEPQAHALARDMSNHESFRNTAQAAGIDIGQIDGYLPRGTPDLPPGSTERITGSGGSGRTGGKVGAEKSRVYDTMEEGVANGEKYPLYPDAVAKSTSALADRIAAAHASELLKPLGSTAGDRIPADMKAQIGGLRNSLTSLNGRLDTAESRAGIANGLGNEAGKWLDTMQNRLGEDWQTPLESAYTGLRQMYRRVDALRARGSQWSGLADSIQQQLDATQAQYDQMLPDWQAAKTQAAQTPRGYSAINLAPLSAHAFPNDIANAANVALDRSRGNMAGTLVTDASRALNTTRTLGDFATFGRMLVADVNHPLRAVQSLGTGIKSVFGHPDALGEVIANQNALAASDLSHTSVNTMVRDYGLSLSPSQPEAESLGGKIRNLPGLAQGARFINTFLDSFRIRVLDDAIDRYRKGGLIDTPGSRKALGNVINLATGVGKLPLLGNDSGLINFPSWLGSQMQFVTKAATDGTIQGAYARESLLKLIGAATVLTYAVNAAQGKDTQWQYGVPRMWLGSTSINPFGPWGSLIKAAAHASPISLDKDHNLQRPDLAYLLRSKGAPPLQIATDLISGYSFSGITPSVTNPNYMVRQMAPYTLSNVGRESPQTWALNSIGARSMDKTPTDRLNELAQAKGFNDYFSAPASAQAAIKGENPDAWAAWVGQASPKEQQYQTAKSTFLAQQAARDQALLSGKLAFKDYKTASDNQNQQLLGQEAQIWGTSSRPPRNAADRYYQEINKATDPNTKVTDWNAVDAWKAQQPTADLNYIDANTGLNKTPLGKLKSSLANTYYAIPKYRGLTPQESDAVDTLYAAVVNGAGVRHDQASLLRSLAGLPNYDQLDPQTVTNVRRKILGGLGATAARQIWLKAHPEAAIFKNSGGTFSPEQIAAINAALAKQK